MDTPKIVDACDRLISAFAWHVDHNDYEALVALFTDDGVFERPGLVAEGHAALMAAMAARPTDRVTRHLCVNRLIDVESPTTAYGRCYVSVLIAPAADGGEPQRGMRTMLVGEYQDHYRLTPDGWRIARRTASIVSQG